MMNKTVLLNPIYFWLYFPRFSEDTLCNQWQLLMCQIVWWLNVSPLSIIDNIFHNTWFSSKDISKFILSLWNGLK